MRNALLSLFVALLLPTTGCDAVSGWAGLAGAGDNASADAAPSGDSGAGNVYYQYVDDSGSVRFVESKREIPAKHRAAAGRIELKKQAPAASQASTAPKPGGSAWKDAAEAPWDRGRQEVVMYTAPWCGVCRRAEAFFNREGVQFTAKDIESNDAYKRELVQKTGRSAVPVIEIGNQRLVGFDQRRIEKILSL